MITKPHLHSVWEIDSAKKTPSSRYLQEELLGTRWTISLLPFGYYTSMELSRLINPSHCQQQRSSHWMISRHMRRPSPIALVQILAMYKYHEWVVVEAKINEATYNYIAFESHDVIKLPVVTLRHQTRFLHLHTEQSWMLRAGLYN